MDFVELQARTSAYRKWLIQILSDIQFSENNTGSFTTKNLDKDTLVFNPEVVTTILEKYNQIAQEIDNLSETIPSVNLIDPTFTDSKWNVTGGTYSVTSISPSSLTVPSDLSYLSELKGTVNILDISVDSPGDPTSCKVFYRDNTGHRKESLYLNGFINIDDSGWQRLPQSLIPSDFTYPENLFEIHIGQYNNVKLLWPSTIAINAYYGGY